MEQHWYWLWTRCWERNHQVWEETLHRINVRRNLTQDQHEKKPCTGSTWEETLHRINMRRNLTQDQREKKPYTGSTWEETLHRINVRRNLTQDQREKKPYPGSTWEETLHGINVCGGGGGVLYLWFALTKLHPVTGTPGLNLDRPGGQCL